MNMKKQRVRRVYQLAPKAPEMHICVNFTTDQIARVAKAANETMARAASQNSIKQEWFLGEFTLADIIFAVYPDQEMGGGIGVSVIRGLERFRAGRAGNSGYGKQLYFQCLSRSHAQAFWAAVGDGRQDGHFPTAKDFPDIAVLVLAPAPIH